jgi:hypothetical protein
MSSAVTNLWRQFVQRRLWPVAILLVAALAAVPLALTEDPAAPAPPPAPVTTSDSVDELAAAPIVAPAETQLKRRKVLGNPKNPFGVVDDAASSSASAGDSSDVTVQETGDGSQSGSGSGDSPSDGGSTTPVGTTPTTPTEPAAPAPAPKKYALHELTVRFGGDDGVKRQSVKRLQALPSEQEPLLIYMGVLKDGKTAVFLVDQGVAPVGDGDCKPSPDDCQEIRLREGETEFLDVKDDAGAVVGQYQLDLIKIHKGSSASASAAKTSSHRTAKSSAHRSELRSVAGRTSAYLP